MNFTVTIGGKQVPCRLPLMPTRFAISRAFTAGLGMRLDESGNEWVLGADGKPAVDPDYDACATVHVASLGLCWAGEPLGVPKREDLLAYGTEVWAELMRRGVSVRDIYSAGRDAFDAVKTSIPTAAEVDEAEGNSEAPAATSTPST